MSSEFGNKIKLSIFGESHGEAIGCVIDSIPAGVKLDMDKIYLVKYDVGDYDNYDSYVIFATKSKSKAKKYVSKFNGIIKKWKLYYSQFESNDCGFNWIKDEYIEKHFYRWNSLREIGKCYYNEIYTRDRI